MKICVKNGLWIFAGTAALAVFGWNTSPFAQQRAGGAAPTPITGPLKVELAEGSIARYRVQEQLAGINFPSEAIGETTAVTGTLAIGADGSINSAQSKITVDLRTLKSDQDLRDGFIKSNRVLDTDKFPLVEFVPRRAVGLTWPPPATPPVQVGFQLVGDMTIHGTTSEVTWSVIATFNNDVVAGVAKTDFTFAQFGVPKPQLARLLTVGDKINLELNFRCKKAAT